VVISGNAFKETEVDFNKGNSRDVVSWLLDDDELEEQLRATQAKREAEEAEMIKNGIKRKGRGKKKLGISSLEGPAASRTLEDMYHEGLSPPYWGDVGVDGFRGGEFWGCFCEGVGDGDSGFGRGVGSVDEEGEDKVGRDA